MDAIFMNSENSKTCGPWKLFQIKINFKKSDEYVAYQILALYIRK